MRATRMLLAAVAAAVLAACAQAGEMAGPDLNGAGHRAITEVPGQPLYAGGGGFSGSGGRTDSTTTLQTESDSTTGRGGGGAIGSGG